eukprot:1416514-Prymnesium_polylepis.1
MNDEEANGADAADRVQAAIDAARRAQQDKIPSFRRLLQALALSIGSHATLAGQMGLPASRLSEFLNDHTPHKKTLTPIQREKHFKDFSDRLCRAGIPHTEALWR